MKVLVREAVIFLFRLKSRFVFNIFCDVNSLGEEAFGDGGRRYLFFIRIVG